MIRKRNISIGNKRKRGSESYIEEDNEGDGIETSVDIISMVKMEQSMRGRRAAMATSLASDELSSSTAFSRSEKVCLFNFNGP